MSAPASSLVRRFTANTQGRDLIVGDVHGCFAKLAEALADVGFDPEAGDRLFSVGDLVDRGPGSDAALSWLDAPWFFAIQGNHEAMACDFAAGSVDPGLYGMNGGSWLIGRTPPERLPFVDAFAALPLAIEIETPAGLVCLVHADCPGNSWPGFIARLQQGGFAASVARDMAQWSRDRINHRDHSGVTGVRAVVVGHTPLDAPVWLGNVLFVDTGAWLQGGQTARPFAVFDAATLAPACRSGATGEPVALNPA